MGEQSCISVVSNYPYDPDFHQFDGFSLYYSAVAPLVWPELSSQQVMVLIPWGETPLRLKMSSKGQTEFFEFAFPEVGIIPPQQLFSFRLSKAQPLMVLCLDLKPLLQANPEIGVDPDQPLVGQYGVRDSVLHCCATVLRDRYLDKSPDNALYFRALIVFLLTHLITTYRQKSIGTGIPSEQTKADNRLDLILRYIDENLEQELKVALLAEKAELSSPHFCRIFKKSTGLSPHRYILLQRIAKAKLLLDSSTMSLLDIALQCGFYDQSHFNLQFRNFTGMTPKAYRDNT